jgi:hypothetical protein
MFFDRFVNRVRVRLSPRIQREPALYDALERRALEPEQGLFSDRFLH